MMMVDPSRLEINLGNDSFTCTIVGPAATVGSVGNPGIARRGYRGTCLIVSFYASELPRNFFRAVVAFSMSTG